MNIGEDQMILNSVLETIGNTPVVRLDGFKGGLSGNIFCKLEYLSPGLSKKDRVALQMIEDAEKRGLLKKGQTVIEVTSGNMGIGLAIVCRLKGYRFIAVISKGNSIERIKMIKAFGAEVFLVDQAPDAIKGKVSRRDIELVEEAADKLTDELGAFRADQFSNPSNPKVWTERAAAEIFSQIDEKIDAFVDFMGTGGCFWGMANALKKKDPNIKCFGVEPYNAPFYAKTDEPTDGTHIIQGGGYARAISFFSDDYLKIADGFIRIKDDEILAASRSIAMEDCIFGGFSTGANGAAAKKLLEGDFKEKNILMIAPDSGTKYLSTALWDI